jgi:hypothetical protein
VERRTLFAVASTALAAVLTAIGTFGGDEDEEAWTWLVVLGVIVVAAGVVFWLVAPRWSGSGRAAVVLAVLGAVSILVFWLGLPAVLAGGAALLALQARERGRAGGAATGALALAALTVAAAVVLAFVG